MDIQNVIKTCPEHKAYIEEIVYGGGNLEDQNFGKIVLELYTLRQQLAQREAEVADAHEALKLYLASTSKNRDEIIAKAKDLVYRTQPTAEAFKAKVWNEAVRACMDEQVDKFIEADLSILLKPESEVV